MNLTAFSSSNFGKWILPGIGCSWFLGGYFLLLRLGISEEQVLVDAFFSTLLFLGGVLLLDRVFRHYTPNLKNGFLLVLFPLLLSGGLVWSHAQLLFWWFAKESDYLELLEAGFFYRWTVYGLVFQLLAVLAVVISKVAGQEELSRREGQLLQLSKEAELAQLRQQLQPHFLFNSLNSIHALVLSSPQGAREMLLLLSDFLRGTLRSEGQSWISLADEIKYLSMYFDIERVRFGHRLLVDFQVQEGVEGLKVPALLVQPLVENAIKYGLYGTLGEVKISLSFQKEGNYLQVSVENPFDGQASVPAGTGFGLSSVERRLFLIFGRTDLLEKNAAQSIFRVHLKIPVTG
ncbi:MAG: histidine kinase [Algoriphagus sp.]|nr:histidine kinase [Algoriphagus sp.]